MDQWVDRLVAMEALAKRLIHTKEEVEWLDEKDLAENGRQKECPILECTNSAELEAEEANKEVVKNVKQMIITRLKNAKKIINIAKTLAGLEPDEPPEKKQKGEPRPTTRQHSEEVRPIGSCV